MKIVTFCLYLLSSSVAFSIACAEGQRSSPTAQPPIATPTATPTFATPTSTPRPIPSPAPTIAPATKGDPTRGQSSYTQLCAVCHGPTAQGDIGPRLASTSLSFEEVRRQVRNPREFMAPYDESVVSDTQLQDIYAWLVSLR